MTTDATTPTDDLTSATHDEVRQQPQAWRDLHRVLQGRGPALRAFLDPLLARPDLRVVFTGAGTSAFVGDIAAATLRRPLRRRLESIATTDLVSDPRTAFAEPRPVLLVSFARSGNSPESVAAVQLADELAPEAHHLVITCNARGRLALDRDGSGRSFVLLLPEQTHDTGFAMTSSFSTMLLAALCAFQEDHLGAVEQLAAAAESVLERTDAVGELLDPLPHRVVHLGSGPLKGLAQEGALKVLELTAGRTASFHDSPLGFRHGPKSVVDDRTLVVVLGSADPHTARYDADMAAELRADGTARVVHVGADGGFAVPHLDGLPDGLRAVALAVFVQLLALSASVRHGCTPDDPFPAGTVNRVVQGVRIHALTGGGDA
ncbi:SIS domain-containing protein [Kineococcus sp. TBRC 1896]|uniref:SIS domain-containing protein n=1 Tax=Kineococcus mangrovi TaxID=1660183 RepID=A0ABV4HXG4_9ACTN